MIGAHVREDVVAKPCDRAVVVAADFDIADLPAPVNRRLNVFAASLYPLHRLAELHGNPSEQSFFGIDVELRAEAAADFGRDDSQFVFGNADHQSKLSAQQVRNLS